MKIVSITDVRQDATNLVEYARTAAEPVLVLQRSRPAAYVVGAEQYEAMQDELRRLRHDRFWQEVAEASTEYGSGGAAIYDTAEELIAGLGLGDDGWAGSESTTGAGRLRGGRQTASGRAQRPSKR